MEIYYVLLAGILGFLSNPGALAESFQAKSSTTATIGNHRTESDADRLLGVNEYNSVEERAGVPGFSAVKNAVVKVGADVKARWDVSGWIEHGKSEAYVRQALGLGDLKGKELRASPKYKYFKLFVKLREKKQRKAWLKANTPTKVVWDEVGLNKVDLAKIKETAAYYNYAAYVRSADKKAWRYNWAFSPVSFELSAESELTAKIGIWAEARRHDEFVEAMLGVNGNCGVILSGPADAVRYFKLFQNLKTAQKDKLAEQAEKA